MAKRYELLDTAWDLVADILHNGRPRADDRRVEQSEQRYIGHGEVSHTLITLAAHAH